MKIQLAIVLSAMMIPLTTSPNLFAVEVAGELFVDLDAVTLSPGDTIWTNNGSYSDFQARGEPMAGMVETTPAVIFDGIDDAFVGLDLAPEGLVGLDPTRSVEVWVLNKVINEEETLVAWGHRGGPDGTNMSVNYGNHGNWGAAAHWGGNGPDIGWIDNNFTPGAPEPNQWHHLAYTYDENVTRVYSDGMLWNEEDTALLWGSLDTYDNTPIAIASQWNNDGSDLEPGIKGSVAIAKIRVHDGVLTDQQIQANYNEEKDQFVNPPSPTPESLPAPPIHRYSFNNPAAGDAFGAAISDSIGNADGVVLGEGSSFTGTELELSGGGSDVAAYVDLPNGIISRLTDMTVEGWVTVNGAWSWQRIFDFGSTAGGEVDGPGGGGEGQDYIEHAAARGTNTNQQSLALRNNDPEFGGEDPGIVSGDSDFIDTSFLTELGEPFHFAVVYNSVGNNGQPLLQEYRDGVLVGEQGATIRLGNLNDVNNWLGRSNWSADSNLEGSYDEFRIYDYALTQGQVLGNIDAGPEVVNAPDVEKRLQAGDADQDFDFDQLDIVKVQIAAKYLTGETATWGEGDWNGAPGGTQGSPPPGNGLFDQLDVVAALANGLYLTGPYEALAGLGSLEGGGGLGDVDLIYVPEPGSCLLLALGIVGLFALARRR